MGTDKLVFAVERCGGTTRSDVTGSDISHMTGSDVSNVPSWSMFCACATGSCAISALMWPFDRKWRQSRYRKRSCPKWPWPEVCSAHARLFYPRFFLSSSNMATEGHLIPSGSLECTQPKLRNTCSDRRSRDPLWKCPWGVLYDVRILYLAWSPELSTRVLYLA